MRFIKLIVLPQGLRPSDDGCEKGINTPISRRPSTMQSDSYSHLPYSSDRHYPDWVYGNTHKSKKPRLCSDSGSQSSQTRNIDMKFPRVTC